MNAESFRQKLNPHEKPPAHIRDIFKRYQKIKAADLTQDADLVDFERLGRHASSVHEIGLLDRETLLKACKAIEDESEETEISRSLLPEALERPIYEYTNLPGKFITHTPLIFYHLHILYERYQKTFFTV
jgi:alkylated DNA repair protein alkB homolog 1